MPHMETRSVAPVCAAWTVPPARQRRCTKIRLVIPRVSLPAGGIVRGDLGISMATDGTGGHDLPAPLARPDRDVPVAPGINLPRLMARGARQRDLDVLLLRGGKDGRVVVAPVRDALRPAADAEVPQQGGLDEQAHLHETGVVLTKDGTRPVEVDDRVRQERLQEENDGGGVEG